MIITGYEALCNLGNNIDEIYNKAINGDTSCFDYINGYLKDTPIRAGIVHADLPKISDISHNIRCNRLLLKTAELMKDKFEELFKKYNKSQIAVITASTNSGVDEFEKSGNSKHYEIGNPAQFLRNHFSLNGFYTTVSTACSSGLVAFKVAQDILNNDVAQAAVVACTDALSKVPIYGFHSLEVLTNKPCIPFSKNRSGMNMGEASAIFIVEKNSNKGIEVLGLAQSSDIYHSTTPDPDGIEAINAINKALEQAKLTPSDIDYINAHGTGTIANDLMEATAIYKIFKDKVPVSSTKGMTGHCLGAAAGIETALCCKLLDNFNGKLYPHIYDNEYDSSLPNINLVNQNSKYSRCKIIMNNSFGFGGTNAILIIGKKNEQ